MYNLPTNLLPTSLHIDSIPSEYHYLVIRTYRNFLHKYNDERLAIGKTLSVVRDAIVLDRTGEPSCE